MFKLFHCVLKMFFMFFWLDSLTLVLLWCDILFERSSCKFSKWDRILAQFNVESYVWVFSSVTLDENRFSVTFSQLKEKKIVLSISLSIKRSIWMLTKIFRAWNCYVRRRPVVLLFDGRLQITSIPLKSQKNILSNNNFKWQWIWKNIFVTIEHIICHHILKSETK